MDRPDYEVEAPRGATSREWEVFVRTAAEEPLTHAGSVSAPTVEVAHEQATQLFGHETVSLWLCPADETRRFQSEELVLDADGGTDDATMDAGEMERETLRGAEE